MEQDRKKSNDVSFESKAGDIIIANSDTNQPDQVDGNPIPVRQPLSNRTSHDEHVTLSKKLSLFLMLTLRSLGIVFGDIGTSPLYVVSTIFDTPPSEDQCIGAISLIIWNLIVVVSVKYAIFILMADNQGEGGTFALCGLLTGERSRLGQKAKKVVIIVSIVAASLIIGDGCLTPAVSVLSAIEGLVLDALRLAKYTVPITVVIVFLLFMAQRWGTAKIGIAFGPVMTVWFLVIFMIGVWRVSAKPVILRAFNPWEALHHLIREKKSGFYQIGGVFLSATGLEAMYADMGHFGKWPIRFAWIAVVFPAVLLNYLGQGALLIVHPEYVNNPFYHAVPPWSHWPMVVLSTVATIIASQAIISGSFSLVSQAVAMGFCVPMNIIHTSKTMVGQIYVPSINYILMILTIIVTVGFRTSARITNAYGVTVCSVMIITTVLFICVLKWTWQKSIWFILPFSLFLIIDLYTWAALSLKIPTGGWVAILIAVLFSLLGFCWYYGQLRLRHFLHHHSQTTLLNDLPMRLGLNIQRQNSICISPDASVSQTNTFDDQHEQIVLHSSSDSDNDEHEQSIKRSQSRIALVQNVPIISKSNKDGTLITMNKIEQNALAVSITPGIGCFITHNNKRTPYVFENFIELMHSIPQVIIFLQIQYARIPVVSIQQRLLVKLYGESIYHITARFGYSENDKNLYDDVLILARNLYQIPISDDEMKVTFFISNQTVNVSTKGWKSWIRRWPLYLYSVLKALYPGEAINIQLPLENTVYIGTLSEL
ncbi:unnamed protein product [Didymodactylos carnosus]|uniref:Potassium transporter n=1 Tax=Didymodactylos carnosus TaxID=1234261 RepID=A0A814F698_9BILA|nr:unnamed protein product [Didymodactylos carnosus]CAF1410525.1 unnamed protein product [Didymodactylos carnosus]CAF3749955.1 unnamed protein product [Didymodactylos carnosus]CAF4214721.1 unnamed protein product [Didymodactylos carnosus]